MKNKKHLAFYTTSQSFYKIIYLRPVANIAMAACDRSFQNDNQPAIVNYMQQKMISSLGIIYSYFESRGVYLLLLFSFLGFLDLTYLTILHYKNVIPPCSLINGCETVLTSKYSTIGSIPISLLGAGYYLAMIIISSILIYRKSLKYKAFLIFLTALGFIISIIYLSIQIFVLRQLCQYCAFSDLMALGVFTVSLYLCKTQL